mmetsp:Transcript_65615/g.192012  ORF Transcript_65615/g.192012 Transcript_65615/m.192012 type:complete len:370 (-) Transcript_65615:45-1154(-)
MSPWRRPPTCYDEDEEANADSYFLFTLLDRDQNAFLDLKEVVQARALLAEALADDNELRDKLGPVDGMLDSSDLNNDAKVIEEEWHDFVRAVYEVTGRSRFRRLITAWRKALVEKVDKQLAEKAKEEEAMKNQGAGKGGKKVLRAKTQGNTMEEAATKIQSNFRGHQTRKKLKKAKTTGGLGAGGGARRDLDKVKMAKEAGRHLLAVVSAAADYGARADFYMDGSEIAFTREHGDFGSGLQVVTIDPETSAVVSRRTYEVFPPKLKAECARLAQDFASIPHGHFVLVANKSYGLKDLNQAAVGALRGVGASFDGLGRTEVSYALIGCKGHLASDEQSEPGVAHAEASVSFQADRRAHQIRGAVPRDLAP